MNLQRKKALSNLPASLEAARQAAREGRTAEAEDAYARLADDPAAAPEALRFLATLAFQRKERGRAAGFLERAVALTPGDPDAHTSLAVVYEADNRLDAAAAAYQAAARIDPKYFVARLRLGRLLERQGQGRRALPHYFAALTFAAEKGQWTSIDATAPGLRADVDRARAAVQAGRRALFHDSLAPVRARYGAASITRIEKALAIYLQETSADIPDARQRPQFMFVPGLPSQIYFDRAQIPFFDQLEGGFPEIRGEAEGIVAGGALPSFFDTDDAAFIAGNIASDNGRAPSWDAFQFYRHGRRYDGNHARAPKTSAIIESLPLARIRGHSPEICFSLLTPGTVIKPHSGVSNCRIVVHLPLIVPENCAISVGGVEHRWQEGRCMAFDDTFVHEAWNRSADGVRVVLLLDTWNPSLTEAERAALTDLITGIGDFNMEVLGAG